VSTFRTAAALVAGAALIGTPLALVGAGAAHADADRTFRCQGARVEVDLEKDHRRFEIDVDLDGAPAHSRWKVVLRHNGTAFHQRVHRADAEGELDLDRSRADTRGRDTFTVKVKRVGGPQACTVRLSRR
jgi:hypothetical protein